MTLSTHNSKTTHDLQPVYDRIEGITNMCIQLANDEGVVQTLRLVMSKEELGLKRMHIGYIHTVNNILNTRGFSEVSYDLTLNRFTADINLKDIVITDNNIKIDIMKNKEYLKPRLDILVYKHNAK